MRRGKPRKGAGGRGGVEGRGRRRGSLRRRKIFFEGRFSAPKMRRPNKINGFEGSVPNESVDRQKVYLQALSSMPLITIVQGFYAKNKTLAPDVIPYGRRGDRFIHRPPSWR